MSELISIYVCTVHVYVKNGYMHSYAHAKCLHICSFEANFFCTEHLLFFSNDA